MYISTLFSFRYAKDWSIEQFAANTHELIYFISGSGEVTIDGEKFQYSPNYVLFMESDKPRDQVAFEETYYICIRFTGSMDDLSVKSNCVTCKNNRIYQIFKNIADEYRQKNIGYYEICNLNIMEILHVINRLSSDDSNVNTILEIIKEIDENHNFSKSVEEMANSTHYSYDYFRHRFKSVTGKSPMQYIIDSKIEHACKMLEGQHLNCTEIAYLLGFSSSSQFSRSFKKKLGVSPSVYKKASPLDFY